MKKSTKVFLGSSAAILLAVNSAAPLVSAQETNATIPKVSESVKPNSRGIVDNTAPTTDPAIPNTGSSDNSANTGSNISNNNNSVPGVGNNTTTPSTNNPGVTIPSTNDNNTGATDPGSNTTTNKDENNTNSSSDTTKPTTPDTTKPSEENKPTDNTKPSENTDTTKPSDKPSKPSEENKPVDNSTKPSDTTKPSTDIPVPNTPSNNGNQNTPSIPAPNNDSIWIQGRANATSTPEAVKNSQAIAASVASSSESTNTASSTAPAATTPKSENKSASDTIKKNGFVSTAKAKEDKKDDKNKEELPNAGVSDSSSSSIVKAGSIAAAFIGAIMAISGFRKKSEK